MISLLSNPASELLAVIPAVAASSGCLERIQTFLLAPFRQDCRSEPDHLPSNDSLAEPGFQGIALQSLQSKTSEIPQTAAIAIEHASITPLTNSEPVLQDISIRFAQGSLSMMIGPVGCGKTMLLRAVRIHLSH